MAALLHNVKLKCSLTALSVVSLLAFVSCASAGKNAPTNLSAENSSLDMLHHFMEGVPLPPMAFPLDQPGDADLLDYEKFGVLWMGIVGQGNGTNSPFERRLRKAYTYFCDEAR